MASDLTTLTNKAVALKNEGRHGEAIEVLGSMVAMAPNNLALHHNHAAVLGDAGRNREAVAILERAFMQGLNKPESWLVYARALAGVQDFEGARNAFLRLLQFFPLNPDVHRELAQLIWMHTGDQAQALQILDQALEANPDAAALHVARAKVVGQTGDKADEYAAMKAVTDRWGAVPELEIELCNAALACNLVEEAVRHGEQARKQLPDNDTALSAYVTALLAAGDAGGALDVLDTLRMRQPVNQLFIALQATAWRLLGDERYHEIYDFGGFVFASPLDAPRGWRSLEAYLVDLIEGLEEAHSFREHPFNQSVRHGSQVSSITGSDNPALAAFDEAASGPVRRYLERLGTGNDVLRRRHIGNFRLFSTWSISLPPGGFHVNHVHPQGWLSSACHVRPAADDPADVRAGWIKFGEPGVATEPALPPEHFIRPEPGVMVLFPSYMWHGTVGFADGPERLTVAADIVPAAV